MKSKMPMISESAVQQYLAEGENPQVEFKSSVSDSRRLSQIFASFANAEGGYILVGVREQGEIVGTNIPLLKSVYDAAISRLSPAPQTQINEIVLDGKTIGVITIQPSKALVFTEGSAFVRVKNGVAFMSPDQLASKLKADHRTLDDISKAIAEQTKTICEQMKMIDELKEQLQKSRSFREKIKDYVIGGGIGWVIGMIPQVLKWWMREHGH